MPTYIVARSVPCGSPAKSPHSAGTAEVVFCVETLRDEPSHLLWQQNSLINPKVVGST